MATVNAPVTSAAVFDKPALVDSESSASAQVQERSVLQWGGIAGLVGALIFIASIVFQVVFLGTKTTAAGAGPVINFPGIRTEIVIGQTLFLVGTVLLMPLFLALYRSLRGSSLAPAIFGTGLSFLGLAVLAVESEPNVAMTPISNSYHAAGATAAQQASAVQLWQATQGMFNQFDTCAYIFLSIGFILLGVAMMGSPSFGEALGGIITIFGVAGVLGVAFFAVTSSAFAIFALLTFVLFPLLIGWKVFAFTRTPARLPGAAPS
jgi:hypothetical protein